MKNTFRVFTKKPLLALIGLGAGLSSLPALAELPHYQSARTLGMGGASVASANPADAAFANPALAATRQLDEHNTFSMILPGAAASTALESEVIDNIDDFQQQNENYNDAIRARDLDAAKSAARFMRDKLVEAGDDNATLGAAAGASLVIPDRSFAWGVFASGAIGATAAVRLDGSDLQFIDNALNANSIDELENTETDGYELQSDARVIGLLSEEVGLTLATNQLAGDTNITLGIAPKLVKLTAYDYIENAASFDDADFDSADYESDNSGITADVGVAMQFGGDKQWQAGLMVKNINPVSVDTIHNTEVTLDTQATAGISHRNEWVTVAADLDLTAQQLSALAPETRYLSVGAEFDVFDTLQIRAGARQNLADSEPVQASLGLGLNLVALRLELAATASEDQTGAALNLGFGF